MNTLLHIKSSLYSDDGRSSQLSSRFVEDWRAAHPDGRVIVRDLAREPVPHLTADRFQSFITAPGQRTPEQAGHVAESDALIEELEAAAIVVLGLPMYNFGIPSTLKAWIDHVARAGRTFRYTENGPVGLLADRPVLIFAARGGKYRDTPKDTQTAYVRDVLEFIGLRDVHFVYAEGLAMGEDARGAVAEARQCLDRLAA